MFVTLRTCTAETLSCPPSAPDKEPEPEVDKLTIHPSRSCNVKSEWLLPPEAGVPKTGKEPDVRYRFDCPANVIFVVESLPPRFRSVGSPIDLCDLDGGADGGGDVDGTFTFRLKANLVFGAKDMRRSSSVFSIALSCYFHRIKKFPDKPLPQRKLGTHQLVLPLVIPRQRPSRISKALRKLCKLYSTLLQFIVPQRRFRVRLRLESGRSSLNASLEA